MSSRARRPQGVKEKKPRTYTARRTAKTPPLRLVVMHSEEALCSAQRMGDGSDEEVRLVGGECPVIGLRAWEIVQWVDNPTPSGINDTRYWRGDQGFGSLTQ